MRIQIEKISHFGSGLFVDFVSPLGGGTSVAWAGPEPKEKESYEIEMDIDDDFIWGESAWESDEAPHIISLNNNILSISAELLQYDHDGCAAISLDGSIILIDISGVPHPYPRSIKLESAHVKLYPINI